MKKWSKIEKNLMLQNAITSKPAFETLAKLWNRCELEIYDAVMDIKENLLDEIEKPEVPAPKPGRKRYHTGTRDLVPSKIKAPKGKRLTSQAPNDIDPPVSTSRPPAVYSNCNVIEKYLEPAMTEK